MAPNSEARALAEAAAGEQVHVEESVSVALLGACKKFCPLSGKWAVPIIAV